MSDQADVKLELSFTKADGFIFKVDGTGSDIATVLVMALSSNEAFAEIATTAVNVFQSNKEDCIKNFEEFQNSK